MQELKKNNKGFTLVELIVVIAILGVLMAVLVPQYIQYVEKSRVGVDESYIGEVAHSLELSIASEESLYGATFSVTLDADGGGKYAIAASGTTTAAQVTTLTNSMAKVFPNNATVTANGTGNAAPVYKSKTYKGGADVVIGVDANGKTSWTKIS